MDVSRWAADRAEVVFARAERFVQRIGVSPEQQALLDTALRGLRYDNGGLFAGPLHTPLFVHAALRGTDEPAVDLAAALVLLNLGIHILDDLQDGDLPSHWAGYSPGEILLAATGLVGVVPNLLLSEIVAPPATIAAMHRTLSLGLVRVAAGQQGDLRLSRSDTVTAEAVEASVVEKSGERRVMFARLAGQLAGAPDDEIEPYERYCRSVGAVTQLQSDVADIFDASRDSSDLLNGTRTLPIVLRLEQLEGEERSQFLGRLGQARMSREVRDAIRQELWSAGIPLACTFKIEVHRQRALAVLAQAEPREPGLSGLRAMTDHLAPLSAAPVSASPD
jgi:geranylgeranyl pyrophosphate synthase